MMGLAAQSVVWKQKMESELAMVAKKSAEATAWEEAAAEDQAASEELMEQLPIYNRDFGYRKSASE